MASDQDEKAALQKLQDLAKQLDAARASQQAAASQLSQAKKKTQHVKEAVVRVTKAVKTRSKQSTRRRKKR